MRSLQIFVRSLQIFVRGLEISMRGLEIFVRSLQILATTTHDLVWLLQSHGLTLDFLFESRLTLIFTEYLIGKYTGLLLAFLARLAQVV